jgi:hypothetical protein
MNYRHAFHAGNFADVFKHAVLTRILVHLAAKQQPFRVLDIHAGAGLYDLASEEASRTGEWREGIGRLVAAAGGADADLVPDPGERGGPPQSQALPAPAHALIAPISTPSPARMAAAGRCAAIRARR